MMLLSPLLITLLLQLQGSDGNPSVTQSPSVKSAALGETVSLSCSASKGVDDDLSWYLQKPGQPPKLLFYKISSRQSDTPSHFSSSGSEPQFTLTISGVQAEDAGDYYCMGVYLVNGANVFTFGGGTKLFIHSGPTVRPSVSLLPPSSEQLSGGSATLLCLLSGYSPQGAQVSWEVDGTAVTEGVLSSSEEEKSGRYGSSSTLSLSQEKWMKGELYSCRVQHQGQSQVQSIRRSQCEGQRG